MLSAGTEAVEAAVKIARTHGKMVGGPAKKVIVSFEGAFHGRTLASQMVGGQPALKDWIGNLDPDIFQAPWPNAYDHEWADPTKPGFSDEKMFQTLLDTIDAHGVEYKNIAGIIIESYYGNLCYPMPKSYAKNLRAFCDKYDIVLMMDEIQIGCCHHRKGSFRRSASVGTCRPPRADGYLRSQHHDLHPFRQPRCFRRHRSKHQVP